MQYSMELLYLTVWASLTSARRLEKKPIIPCADGFFLQLFRWKLTRYVATLDFILHFFCHFEHG